MMKTKLTAFRTIAKMGAIFTLAPIIVFAQTFDFPNATVGQNRDCFTLAAEWQGIHAGVLRAISIQENRRCDGTISKNTNGSVDVGCMQINSIHFKELAKHRVLPSDLQDQCKNVFVGAWHYRKMVDKYGDTWKAVGAYHSEKPKFRDPYAQSVERIFIKYKLYQ